MNSACLVLASASPRRKELLTLFELPFTTRPADIDETQFPSESPRAYVRRLAEGKGAAVSAGPGELVLSADTIVDLGGSVLGKPENLAQSRQMLQNLRAALHQVYTALRLTDTQNGQSWQALCESVVEMRVYSEAEMEAYLATGDQYDKAGGYAIQDRNFHPVKDVKGCYANVMGLPLCHLCGLLAEAGIPVDVDIPSACQRHLEISCQVYPEILAGLQPAEMKR